MKIEKQEASGSIYNISGDFVNNAPLRADSVYLSVGEGIFREFARPDQNTLKLQFGIDYLAALSTDLSDKKLITRQSISEFLLALEHTKEIAIVGNPGVGKTCMLYSLSMSLGEVIFINLKNRSIQTVLLHLINRINIKNENHLIDTIDVESGLELLQGILLSTELTFMFDECEESDAILQRLLPLNKGKNTFIYASQAKSAFEADQIEVFPLGNFDSEDAKDFLAKYDIVLDVFAFNDLYEASKGNALYLYYFSQFSISPLPKGINSYQRAIWQKLSNSQKECLIYVSIAQFPVSISSVAELLFENKVQEAVQMISELRLLNRIENGELEVFHPAFKVFVLNDLVLNGTESFYRVRLGEYFKEKNDLLQAVYLLIDADPKKIEDFGFEVLPVICNKGDIDFANKLIYELLENQTDEQTEGYLKLLLYQNRRYLRKKENTDLLRDEALALLEKSVDRRLYLSALMNKAMDLIEDGEIVAGSELADFIMAEDDGGQLGFTGQLLVSLSKVYIDLHQHKKAADACKKSFNIFAEEANLYGMLSSLANLASCLNHVDGYRDLSEEYALKLLQVPANDIYFGLVLIAHNVLTSIYRQKKDFDKAKMYGIQAVALSQQFKLIRKALLNLVNYGNIFRDIGEIPEALKIFEEALSHAVELDVKREQCRIYWIMSSIYVDLGKSVKGLELINRAVSCAEAVNYEYGIAHCFQERGEILELHKDYAEAGKSFERSYIVFADMGNMNRDASQSLTSAILMYMKANNKTRLDELVRLSISSFGSEQFMDLSGIAGYEDNTIDIHGYFLGLTQQYLSSDKASNQISAFLDYLKYCKDDLEHSKKHFKTILLMLASSGNNKFGLTTLGILIEQSGALIDFVDLRELISCIRKNNSRFIFRETFRDSVFLLSDPLGFNIEMNAHKEDLLGSKLCIEFLLFLMAIKGVLGIEEATKRESFCKIIFHEAEILNQVIRNRGGKELRFTSEQQTHIISIEEQYVEPIIVVVGDEYESISDLIKNRGTKSNLFFLRALICEISAHFYHMDGNAVFEVTQGLTGKIAALFDYTNVDQEFEREHDYGVDLSRIDALIT